jgi:rubrerythrin
MNNKACPGILEVLEDAIQKERRFKTYLEKCSSAIGNPNIQRYFLELAAEEEAHRQRLQTYLDDLKAEYAVYEAITESDEHLTE